MALFLVQFGGKRLCPLSGHDLSKLLEIGAVRGQDPVYSYKDKQWYYIDECQGFAKYYDDTPRNKRAKLPAFTPPPLDSLQIITLTEVREVIKEVTKEVVIEKEAPPGVPIERVVEHFVSPDPELYVEREFHEQELAQKQQANERREIEWKRELSKLNDELNSLSSANAQIEKFKRECERERKRNDSLQFSLLDLKEEVLSLQIKNIEFERDAEELRTLKIRLGSQITSLERENQTLKIILDRTSPAALEENELKLKKYEALKKSHDKLKATLTNRDQTILELEEQLADLSAIDEKMIEQRLRAEIQNEYKKKWQIEKDKLFKESISNEHEREHHLKSEFELERNELSEKLESALAQIQELEAQLSVSTTHFSYSEADLSELRTQLEKNSQREIKSYQELLAKREEELSDLQRQLTETNTIISNLQAQAQSEGDELDQLHANQLQAEQLKNAKLASELQQIQRELKVLKERERSQFQAQQQGSKQEEVLKQKIVLLQKQGLSKQKESEELAQKFRKATIQIQKYKLKLEAAAEIIDKLKSKSKVKNEEISKLKEEITKLSDGPTQLINMNEIGLEQQKRPNLKLVATESSETPEHSEAEIAKLIGDSFEVPNLPDWKIKTDKGIQGPYNYSEMLSLKAQGQINDQTLVKKKAEGSWKALKDCFELTTKVITHKVEVDGELVTKYYIKRGSFRAPFYEVCSFDLQGNEVRGHCTSLSIGGAFIELNRLDGDDSLREKKVFLRFSKGTLSAPFGVTAIIKNVSQARPKGIGVMFVDLPDHGREAIIEYINNYLEKLSSGAA